MLLLPGWPPAARGRGRPLCLIIFFYFFLFLFFFGKRGERVSFFFPPPRAIEGREPSSDDGDDDAMPLFLSLSLSLPSQRRPFLLLVLLGLLLARLALLRVGEAGHLVALEERRKRKRRGSDGVLMIVADSSSSVSRPSPLFFLNREWRLAEQGEESGEALARARKRRVGCGEEKRCACAARPPSLFSRLRQKKESENGGKKTRSSLRISLWPSSVLKKLGSPLFLPQQCWCSLRRHALQCWCSLRRHALA